MPAKTFSICGQTVTVSETYDAYNTLRLQFVQEASSAAHVFGKRYDSYGNIDNVIEHGLEDGFVIIAEIIDRVVINGVLMNLKIYDIDARRFFEEFYQRRYFHWDEDFEKVQDSYMAIRLEQKQLDEYRTMRRQNRSRWVGGGFGIEGALKGAMKAGALNMASGALHGLFNAGAKAISMADESNKKSSLYKNAKKGLVHGIWRSVYEIHFAAWNMLEERGERMYVEYLASGAKKQAEATVNNFAKMPKEEVRKIFPQILLLNPYSEELYKSLFSIFGDADGGLQRTAKYFGVDTSFVAKGKEALADKIFADVKQELGQSEQAALNAKTKYELALQSQGVGDTRSAQKHLEAIEDKLRDFDIKARTAKSRVKEIIFDTREEAEKAREEISKIDSILDGLDYEHSEDDARKALEKLEGYSPSFRGIFNDYLDKVKALLSSFNSEASTVSFNGISVVLEREEAEKVKAMPEFSELVSSWEKYKTERTNGALNHIAELLEKMPSKIRKSYWGMISEFEAEQQKLREPPKIRIKWFRVILCYAVAIAGLAFSALHWDSWNWVGMKGIVTAFMFLVPVIAMSGNNESDNDSNCKSPNGVIILRPLAWCYWCASFLTLVFPSWESYEWIGGKGGIVIVTLLILLVIMSCIRDLQGNGKESRKASEYLSDFEKLSSQSKEYRNFKMTNKK